MNTQANKQTIRFHEIEFGYADGVTEADNDNFTKFFYESADYQTLKNVPDRFIVHGTKGSGKTLLAKYYQKKQSMDKYPYVSNYIKFEDFEKEEFIEFEAKEIEVSLKRLFNTFYVYKKVLETLIDPDNELHIKDFSLSLAGLCHYVQYLFLKSKLQELYNEMYKKELILDTLETHRKIINTNGIIAKPSPAINTKSNSETENSETKRYTVNQKRFHDFTKEIETYILKISNHIKFDIIFDDFDDLFNCIDSDTDNKIKTLIGFIKDTTRINDKLKRSKNKCRCFLILRTDMIDLFNSLDPNISKIINDRSIQTIWNNGTKYKELSNMVCHKIVQSYSKIPIDIPYVEKNFIKETHAPNQKSKIHTIIQYTLGRPRDLIQYFNKIKSLYPEETSLSFNMIKSAESVYSTYFKGEIQNEMSTYYSSEVIIAIFSLLSKIGRKRFNIDVFNLFFEQEHDEVFIKNGINSKELLSILYRFNIIGIVKNKYHISFIYYGNAKRELAPDDKKFCIHFGLHRSLNLS